MALPQKEWRAYLDSVLDGYMRANLISNATDHMVDRMEEIFAEYLQAVPEYSPHSIFPLSLDPLQAYLAHPEVRDIVAAIPPNILGIEEKWVVKRDILDYIKGVLELNSMKPHGVEQRRVEVPSIKCWHAENDPAISLAYMEPAVLTRVAQAQTPLRAKGNTSHQSAGNHKSVSKFQSDNIPPNTPSVYAPHHDKRMESSPHHHAPSSMLIFGIKLETIPLEQETLSKSETEKLVMPKLSIPRVLLNDVWNCIKATPFSSSLKARGILSDQTRSKKMMADFEDDSAVSNLGIPRCMSPPLFSRVADKKSREDADVSNGAMHTLGEILELVILDTEMEQNHSGDVMETMRIAEGWPTVPLDLRSSSTQPLMEDVSRGSYDAVEDDDQVLQIEELRVPSSPPFNNKELKKVFRDRMDEILLPRGDYPFHRRGPPQSALLSARRTGAQASFSSSIIETMQLSGRPAVQRVSKTKDAPDLTSDVTSPGALNLVPDVDEVLDGVCGSIKHLDKYFLLTKEHIEEKDGRLLPVPSLPPPNEGIMVAKLACLSHLNRPFDFSPLSESMGARGDSSELTKSVTLVETARGVVGLKLELSWQPFVYRGPVISHETLCQVNHSPYDHPKAPQDLVSGEVTALLQGASRMLQRLTAVRRKVAGGNCLYRLWEKEDGNVSEGQAQGTAKGNTWSDDGVLLLTRSERIRVKGVFPSAHQEQQEDVLATGLIGDEILDERHPHSFEGLGGDVSHTESIRLDQKKRAPVDDMQSQRPNNQLLPVTQQSTEGLTHFERAESPMEVDDMAVGESGSSRGPGSAFGMTRTPGDNTFPGCQGREETREAGEYDMDFDESGASPSPLIHHDLRKATTMSPGIAKPLLSHHSTAFSNVGLLQNFLAQRGVTSHLYASPSREYSLSLEEPASTTEDSSQLQQIEGPIEFSCFPPGFLSKEIVIAGEWLVPFGRHRYLASLPFLQRRGLVQYLSEGCSVDLCETEDLQGPDLVLDSHTAIKLVTVSDVVPSNLDALCSSITELGYDFTRIIVILEAYPFARSMFSTQRLECENWEDMRMLTETVVSTGARLKRTVGVRMGLLSEDGGLGEDALGHVQVEFLLSSSVGETARLVRHSGDYAEKAVGDWERVHFWGDRPWLEVSEAAWDANLLGQARGLNTFAGLAILSVIPLQKFIDLPLSEKLRKFGGLVGAARMQLFASSLTHSNP